MTSGPRRLAAHRSRWPGGTTWALAGALAWAASALAAGAGPREVAGGWAAPRSGGAQLVVALSMLALGGCNGSLAELISRRLPAQRSLWWPPSACESCGRRLRWWHNLPLLSFPCLAGRCAFCRAAIPPRAWAVELVMAALAWALWWRLDLGAPLLLWLPLTVPIMAVSLCDIDHWWVPDGLTLAAALWVVGVACLSPDRSWLVVGTGLLPAALLWAVGWCFVRLRGFEGLGMGDIKWAAVMGMAVGGPAAWSMVFWASLQGAAAALFLRAWRRLRPPPPPASERAEPPAALLDDADWQPPPGALPFAPFLGLAAVEAVLFPQVFAIGATPLLAALSGLTAGR